MTVRAAPVCGRIRRRFGFVSRMADEAINQAAPPHDGPEFVQIPRRGVRRFEPELRALGYRASGPAARPQRIEPAHDWAGLKRPDLGKRHRPGGRTVNEKSHNSKSRITSAIALQWGILRRPSDPSASMGRTHASELYFPSLLHFTKCAARPRSPMRSGCIRRSPGWDAEHRCRWGHSRACSIQPGSAARCEEGTSECVAKVSHDPLRCGRELV